jgi:hypothetical protein
MGEIRLAAWKLWVIAGAVVASTVLVTGLVVGSWRTAPSPSPAPPPAATAPKPPAPPAGPAPAAPPPVRKPSRADVQACNQVAERVGREEKTKDVLTKAVVGGLIGAGVGAAGGAIADGGKGAGKGAAIGGIVGATAGTLYGLSDANSKNPRARDAYRSCLQKRGYAG